MVKCPNCGEKVQEGKYCEKCGAPINGNKNPFSSGGSFLDSVKAGMNKTATDLMAIKSNYSNNILICMVNKIPNVQEKKIKVNDDEIVYFNSGSGFTKYTQTFTSELNQFFVFFVKKTQK